eukprot:9027816-Pyramimonas_sp.AAC.1
MGNMNQGNQSDQIKLANLWEHWLQGMRGSGMMNQVGGQFSNQSSSSNNYGGMFNGGNQQQMNQYGMQQGSQMGGMQQQQPSINITPLSDMDNNIDPCFQQM